MPGSETGQKRLVQLVDLGVDSSSSGDGEGHKMLAGVGGGSGPRIVKPVVRPHSAPSPRTLHKAHKTKTASLFTNKASEAKSSIRGRGRSKYCYTNRG
ncbi:hypothetical protein DPMN_097851 [Dreissena polymorpha]|uniref:Uncharacterized protein n=1 Tax=Dreissena polymorpha TaxID=45954 RepID=A0A9D4R4X8_DREPO|nr:hypothetical protein DPMN_097851 [Dreissena polymorpha]